MENNLKDTNVILTVNVGAILNHKEYPIPKDKIKEWVNFFDDRGDTPGNGNNFDSKIDKTKKIVWRGIPKVAEYYQEDGVNDYPEYTIQIIRMDKIEPSLSLLKKDTYENKNGKGVVVGHVKKDESAGIEVYSLTFLINKDYGKPYTIDPKMHM